MTSIAPKSSAKPSNVRVISRAFEIIELFAAGSDRLTMMEVVNATGLSKATAFRLLSTLVEDDILRQTPAGEYELGFFSVQRAEALLSAHPMVQRFRPTMKLLAEELGETIILSQRDRDMIVDLEVIQAPTDVVNVPAVGCPALLHTRIPGLSILRALARKEKQDYQRRYRLGADDRRVELAETAETGHSVTQEVFAKDGQIIGVIWILVPWGRRFDRTGILSKLREKVADRMSP